MKIQLTKKIGFLLALVISVVGASAQAARTTTYMHSDALGSVIAASDEQGELLWRKQYQPFGSQVEGGNDSEEVSYTGKKFNKTTGLSYYGARHYDPFAGRFVSNDPVGALGATAGNTMMFNRYAYANNNPYLFVDPTGTEPKPTNRQILEAQDEFRINKSFTNAKSVGDNLSDGADIVGEVLNPDSTILIPGSIFIKVSKGVKATKGVTRFKNGELFGHTINTSKGPVDFLAETVVKGDTLILKDVAVFGRKGAEALTGLQKEIFRGAAQLKQFAREQGFKRLQIQGRRVETSSSARPGHDVNLDFKL